MNINRTIIVTLPNAQLARTIASALSAGGAGMFESEVLIKGEQRFISSGQLDSAFDTFLPLEDSTQAAKDAAAQALHQASGGLATLAQCKALVDTTIVVNCDLESAEATVGRLNAM